jgi:hypothetical protein
MGLILTHLLNRSRSTRQGNFTKMIVKFLRTPTDVFFGRHGKATTCKSVGSGFGPHIKEDVWVFVSTTTSKPWTRTAT